MAVSTNSRTQLGAGPAPKGTAWTTWWRRWPTWAPRAAPAWGAVYAVVQTAWAATGTSVPVKPHEVYPPGAQLALAALAVLGGAAAWAITRPLGRPGRVVVSTVLAAALLVFGAGALGVMMIVVTLVTLSGIESATGAVHTLLNAVGATFLLMTVVAYRRRRRGGCPRCGRPHAGAGDGTLIHPSASMASARTQVTAYVFLCGLLPWAGLKTIWTLGGDALGVMAEGWRKLSEGTGAAESLASVGLDVSVMAALLGVFLLTGLMYRWGMVFPRWTLFLSGRRVPRLLPLIPAWLTGGALSVYGVVLNVIALLSATGVISASEPKPPFTTSADLTWMVWFGGLAFSGLGFALIVAARSYAARTRYICTGVESVKGAEGAETAGA
ncbi:hypothetical protein ACTWQF_18365 [Streptomyces sp. 8N114]|uniref:hypothetical protein n=1 Tax=Streptomyces sp. 8N114 TaxID=3457419 RepID=UPI003FCF3249